MRTDKTNEQTNTCLTLLGVSCAAAPPCGPPPPLQATVSRAWTEQCINLNARDSHLGYSLLVHERVHGSTREDVIQQQEDMETSVGPRSRRKPV